jgi:diguanylate cyclase (GGDEF)-like protein
VRDDILLFPRVRSLSMVRPEHRNLEPEVDTSLSKEDDTTAREPKQFPDSEILTNWLRAQESLADKTGVALGTLESESSPVGDFYNDNSICRAMLASPEHAQLCALDCGRAYSRAARSSGTVEFRCHAGLQCFAVPLNVESRRLVVLGGRTFRSPSDYSQFLRRYSDLEAIASGKALGKVKFASQREMLETQQLVTAAAQYHLVSARSRVEQSGATSHLLDAHLEIIRLTDELANRAQAIAAVTELLQHVTLALDATVDYDTVLGKLAIMMKAERASLMILDQDSNELGVEATYGFSRPSARIKMGEAIAGAVLASGSPMIVRNVDVEPGIPRTNIRRYRTKSFISFPIAIGGRKIGVLNLTGQIDGEPYEAKDLSLVELMATHMALMIDRSRWHKKAEEFQQMSLTDPLTGLPNRRYLEERLFEEVERSKRHGTPLSFLIVDVDSFKSYNDQYGHTSADYVLIKTAQALRKCIRTIDMSARYAGDEFCIILPETEVKSAAGIAERLRGEVGRAEYKSDAGKSIGRITISVGVSSFSPDRQSPLSIMETADRALYQAKTRGRNCVVVFEDSSGQTGSPSHTGIGGPTG